MSDARYRLSNSRFVAGQIHEALAEAERTGRQPEFRRALRWIVDELKRTPLEFGESREGSSEDRLQLRIAFVNPLFVKFGVHEPSRTVFISHVGYQKR